jgi:Ku protein
MACMLPALSRTRRTFLHICQNPGGVDEEVLHLLADKIEAHHPHGINDNIRKLKAMRSIWTGSIGFGLVSIPIKLFSAVQETRLDLDMLDSRDHAHIKFQRVNENTKKEVPYDKIVKGYKYDDDYVIIEDADFEAAAPEKSKVIEIESFVDLAAVNPMYYETSYYTEPATKKNKAYALLLAALKKSGKAGLARFRTAQHRKPLYRAPGG